MPKVKTISIADEVMDVLKRSTITDTSLKLPDGQLDRTLYDKVNKIIVTAGGKWSRSHRAHLFTSDPRAALGMALETGEVLNVKQTFQEFFTPADLAEELCDLGGVNEHDRVLEPSAGHGNIALAALRRNCRVICCEIQSASADKLRDNSGLIVWEGDFLKLPNDMFRPMDKVVMNPPFTGGQDREHVQHAFNFLRPGGMLVSIMSGNTSTGTTKAHKSFQKWVEELDGEFIPVEDGAFKESGTGVKTEILRIRRPER